MKTNTPSDHICTDQSISIGDFHKEPQVLINVYHNLNKRILCGVIYKVGHSTCRTVGWLEDALHCVPQS